jgi:hypothetical protein
MTMILLRLLFFLSLLASAAGEKPSFLPKTSFVNQIPRGGAVDKTVIAKAALYTLGAASAVSSLSPSKYLEAHGLDSGDATSQFLVSEAGSASLNAVLIAALQIFKGFSFQEAVGWSCLPYIFNTIEKLLNDKHVGVSIY